jgi:plasmid maintenance system antidote protein VapI
LWNICAGRLREELKPYGAKARFARFLGIPRQRVNDFLKGRSRLPDAGLTLQMMSWFAQKQAGRDLSL